MSDSGRIFCPQCGFGVETDEDGCCESCGATACLEDFVRKQLEEITAEDLAHAMWDGEFGAGQLEFAAEILRRARQRATSRQDALGLTPRPPDVS